MALSASQLAIVSRLLDEALALSDAERSAWLDALPAEHASLAPLLSEMLARANQENAPLLLDKKPVLPFVPTARNLHAGSAKAGDLLGPYQLIRELGIGGMGEVWLAKRADGAYRRDVALKLPKRTLLPLLLARFEQERDILASLEHPNIARLYDAGVAPTGVPYLAMEYVQGHPLTTWCDANRVGLRERLELFLQVTRAVQHAHECQVVHRDLKPSNILVAKSGQVCLLDFGIAKMLEESQGIDLPVDSYARAITPDYASPELLTGQRVDGRSDVYSLGVVLYELLTGSRPYRLMPSGSVTRIGHQLADVFIDKPSAHLAPGAGPTRATTQDRLAGRLHGELDAITLKALAKRPEDRYDRVEAMSEDLQRYLRGERVAAMPPPNRFTTTELMARLSRNPKVRIRGNYAGVAAGAALAPEAQDRTKRTTAAVGPIPESNAGVRIEASLIREVDGTNLWSLTHDLNLEDGLRMSFDVTEEMDRLVAAVSDAGTSRLELVISIARISTSGRLGDASLPERDPRSGE
jgi:serine/threonine-protein kinase